MFQNKLYGFSKTTICKYISSNREKISNFRGKHLIYLIIGQKKRNMNMKNMNLNSWYFGFAFTK